MKRIEKVEAILAEFKDINTIPVVVESLKSMSRHSIRIYANVLVDNGLLERIDLLPYQAIIKRFAYFRTELALTAELFEKVDADVTATYYKKRHVSDEVIAQRKAEKDMRLESKKQKATINATEQEGKSEDEKSGIYKLSSAPSKYFIDKFEAQSKLARENFKSPKNHPGVSAGMVW